MTDQARTTAVKECDQINALRYEYAEEDGGGWLSTLVWNTRNAYLTWPNVPIETKVVRLIVEGFLAEIEDIKKCVQEKADVK